MRLSQLSADERARLAAQLRAELASEGHDVDARLARFAEASRFDFEKPPAWMLAHAGQMEAWNAQVRFLRILAGWQSGKTDFLVWYCLRQFGRRGPGDAIVAAATFPLLTVALQPRLVRAVESRGLGVHRPGAGHLHVPYDSLRKCGYEGDEKGDLFIWFRHASDAKAVEAATANWFALDEAGQTSDEVGEAVQGRVSGTGGEACLISRHYNDSWFSRACQEADIPGFSVTVSFASWDNPGWRKDLRDTPGALEAEVERLKLSMPEHRFLGKYAGEVSKPAGLIIDNWSESFEYEDFLIPGDWKRFTFHDFGPVHAFSISVAEHPTEKDRDGYPVLYCYRELFPNRATSTKAIVRQLRKADVLDFAKWAAATDNDIPVWKPRGIGGNKTGEQGWRESYCEAGLDVEEPTEGDVGTQIDRLYACVGRGGLRISKKGCPVLISMLTKWSWEVDDAGEPIPGKIKDDAKFHGPAGLRYGVSQLRPYTRDEDEKTKQEFPQGSVGSYLPEGWDRDEDGTEGA